MNSRNTLILYRWEAALFAFLIFSAAFMFGFTQAANAQLETVLSPDNCVTVRTDRQPGYWLDCTDVMLSN